MNLPPSQADIDVRCLHVVTLFLSNTGQDNLPALLFCLIFSFYKWFKPSIITNLVSAFKGKLTNDSQCYKM